MTLSHQIEEALNRNPHGWCSVEKADVLASCVVAMGGGTCVEIGLYTGRSFLPMALAVKHLQNGIAIGIDPFSAAASVEGEEKKHADWWMTVDHDGIENIFRENLAELELDEWTLIHKKKSDDVDPPKGIAVLHIDGSHSDQAIRDTQRFAANVVMGGFVMMDDVSWDSGAVQSSIGILKDMGFVERRRLVGEEANTIYDNDWSLFQRIA